VLLEVRVIASPLVLPEGARTRVGLIVPRFRHSAVARNRVKRRLRELARTRLLPTDIAADVVVRIRPEAYRADFSGLAADVERIRVRLVSWRAEDSGPLPALAEPAESRPSDT
jgi:ribonuclease P protein component